MPELPEVETVCRGLAEVMEGRVFRAVAQNRPDLRFPFPERFAARLTGRRIAVMNRRAKYILVHLDAGEVLIMHLGMSGRFTIDASGRAGAVGAFRHRGGIAGGPHDHVVFDLDDGCRVVYSDPRRFGLMTLCAADGLDAHPLLRHLGVEPLGNGLTAAWLADALAGRRVSLKAALLDQKVIAGVGNIYACEALFRARLSPERLAASLGGSGCIARARAEDLVAAVRSVLAEAIAAGGSTLRDYARTDGEIGYFQHSFDVYDREGEACAREGCMGLISRIVQSNRSTFFCSACQK
jgi:formamidopyrimidine-DNA glycosylase